MDEEIKSIKKNDTWELAQLPKGHKAIGVKWVYKVKKNAKGEVERFKARLVAKGFQQLPGIDYFDTFSPVVKPITIRLVFSLATAFSLKHLGKVSYFLGLQVHYSPAGILLNQSKYILDLLKKTNMETCNPCATPHCLNQKLHIQDSSLFENPTLYRSTIGALQYLTLTRPDISYIVNKLSQFLQAPTTSHWGACKRVLRYLKGSITHGILFQPSPRLNLESFADADWASSVDDRKSTSGYCVFLGPNLIAWSSKKQSVVARSSTEAEYRSLASATAELVWIKSFFAELGISILPRSVIWCDNISAISLASNPVFHARTKHIEVDVHFIREKVASKEVEVRFLPSEEQLADVLTKPIVAARFQNLCFKLSLQSSPSLV
ncbi:hypothetical protein DH2020_006462 [Rehmannia glutinosa]|uniref:Reverse transcriptase Ty1/copia-type domain-containing protein n=1 Tax=Rehmannia glutinosa TaxID=99300 RepID=A0ABR0XJI9_REHGL